VQVKGRQENSSRLGSRAGFTVMELIVYFVLSVLVVSAMYELLAGQNRLYSKQRELTDVRSTLRAAAEILTAELRMSAASEGDISTIERDSLRLRSVEGSGVVCGMSGDGEQTGLFAASGEFFATADDSVMLYATGSGGTDDDAWVFTTVTDVLGAGGGSVPSCTWGPATEEVIVVDTLDGSALAGVAVGSEVRAFRWVTYGLLQEGGVWWLGRKVGGTGSYEKLVGPMLAPADSGVAFYYYDAMGATTSNPADVALVEILLRGASLRNTYGSDGTIRPQEDSVRTRVSLRG
jgi:hypothetical protein